MNLLFRFFMTILLAPLRSKLAPTDTCKTHFTVWPTDLDVLFHMNNGIYFSLMDLGRVDFMVRTGLWKEISKKGWYPVVVSETQRFKKSLQLFQKFTIQTTPLGWDDKYFYLEQIFVSKNKVNSAAMIKARFLSKKGDLISPQAILDLVSDHKQSPVFPEYLQNWIKSDSEHIKKAI